MFSVLLAIDYDNLHQMLHILQSHYPERLGLALIINVPFLVNAFLKLIMPFVDPVTRNKVKLNPQIFEEGYMAKEQVMQEWWGGDRNFEYDHSKYWPGERAAVFRFCSAFTTTRMRQLSSTCAIPGRKYRCNVGASSGGPSVSVNGRSR